jgi:hypothetical protein
MESFIYSESLIESAMERLKKLWKRGEVTAGAVIGIVIFLILFAVLVPTGITQILKSFNSTTGGQPTWYSKPYGSIMVTIMQLVPVMVLIGAILMAIHWFTAKPVTAMLRLIRMFKLGAKGAIGVAEVVVIFVALILVAALYPVAVSTLYSVDVSGWTDTLKTLLYIVVLCSGIGLLIGFVTYARD